MTFERVANEATVVTGARVDAGSNDFDFDLESVILLDSAESAEEPT